MIPLSKQGFSLYLTFLVTTVLFILVTSTYEISRISLDIGHSSAIDAITFHAADGGLERGLAKLRKKFKKFEFGYKFEISSSRFVEVLVKANPKGKKIDLSSTATLFEGKKAVSTRQLMRQGIIKLPGRAGSGRFLEAS
jgi:hypothetical protein